MRHGRPIPRESRAAAANSGNTSLIIIQTFTFLGILVGFIYKGWERHADLTEVRRKEDLLERLRLVAVETAAAEAKTANTKLDQIHTLVNSNLTAEFENELELLQSNLALLKAAAETQQATGITPSAETIGVIENTRLRILRLTSVVADRKLQAEIAATQKGEVKPWTPSTPS